MAFLGFCKDTGAVYEGNGQYNAARVFPSPVLTPATLILNEEVYKAPSTNNYFGLLFREDSFDPITQTRRGRLYTGEGFKTPIQDCTVQDPYLITSYSVQTNFHKVRCQCYTSYHATRIKNDMGALKKSKLLLGGDEYFSVWNILAVETCLSGEHLYTLKSLRSLNRVPDLSEKTPKEIVSGLTEKLNVVSDSIDRLGPESVIDRVRDAFSIIFGHLSGDKTKDLGDSIKKYNDKNNNGNDDMKSRCGKIVARLHARVKPNEQNARSLRPILEEDAQLALSCLIFILNELQWSNN